MPEETAYESLLEDLYKRLPEKKSSGERFEVPQADLLLQGPKTLVKNYDEICQKLRRDPAEVAKWLSRELAAPATREAGRLVLQGKFSPRTINERINDYVQARVLCKECGRPDTRLETGERGFLQLKCEACGARSPVRK
jgi:translation initiation factor 2 subunit 2